MTTECTTCKGRGALAVSSSYSRCVADSLMEETCEDCQGAGEVAVLTEAEAEAELIAWRIETVARMKARQLETAAIAEALDRVEARLNDLAVA